MAGRPVVSSGNVLTPSRVGAIAAVGAATVDVFDRPTVAILSTGNEVVQPGATLREGQVHDINQFTISAVVRRHGGVARPLPPAGDTLEALHTALDAGLASDVIVFSGGSSVGGRDLMVDLVSARGDVMFHGIAVKPGKPTLFGRVGRTLVFGMPGYPTSCLSNAYMLLLPLVRLVARLPPWTPQTSDASACPTCRVDADPPSVLHGANCRRTRRACVQGLRRHHEHGERGWLLRDSGRRRCSSKRGRPSRSHCSRTGSAGLRFAR